MRNKKLLNTLVLFGVCASLFSLASCQAVKGEQGEPGTPGVDGKPGQDGEDGKDGNTWLTGEGSPASSLGKNGDLYLDTATCDYYVKKDGSWVKTGNIKGEDGEDGKPGENGKPGQDGEDGTNGSTGSKGETAWSNTILPDTNGYVVPSLGSALVGDEIYFTVSLTNTDYYVDKVVLLDSTGNELSLSVSLVNNVVTSEKTKMKAGGFVVSAKYIEKGTTGYVDGKLHNGTYDAVGKFTSTGEAGGTNVAFSGGDGKTSTTALGITEASQLESIADVSVPGTVYFKLEVADTFNFSDKSIIKNDQTGKDIVLDLNEKQLVINKDLGAVNNSEVTIKNGTISGNLGKNLIAYEDAKITFDDVKSECGILIGSNLDTSFGHTDYKNIEVNIKDSEINCVTYGLSTNASYASDPTKYSNIVINVDNSELFAKDPSGKGDCTGVLINVPATVNITNKSHIKGERQALIVRGGNVSISDSTIEYDFKYDGSDGAGYYKPEEGLNWGSGNQVATAGIVVGNTATGTYKSNASLTLNNVTYIRNSPENTSITFDPNDICIADNGLGTYKSTVKIIDTTTYSRFDKNKIFVKESEYSKLITPGSAE